MHVRRAAQLAMTLVLAAVLTGGVATAATADPPYTLAFSPDSATFEYGDYWSLTATAPGAGLAFAPFVATATMTGTPAGYAPVVNTYMPDSSSSTVLVEASQSQRSLPAGSYTATATLTAFNGAGEPATTATPAHLTITPAALGISVKIGPDPSNSANAIISAAFTGDFVDNFASTSYAPGPLTPAGTWSVQVTGADGKVAHQFSVARTSTDDVLAISNYWSDVPPGQYAAHVTFTPSGESAQNFAIGTANAASYTAAAAPGSGSTAPPAPPAPAPAASSGQTMPLWLPVAVGAVSAALLALLIIQIVRGARRPRAAADAAEVTA